MTRGPCRLAAALGLILALAHAPLALALQTPQATEEAPVRGLLDAIRTDLVELRFESALTGIEALLGRPDMSAAERVEALVLRAQAHVAIGDLGATEQDYGEILSLRPGYRPDPTLTPKKAMDRFEKVRAQRVGRIKLAVDPPEATLTVDGVASVFDSDGMLWALVGEREVRAEHPGFDPAAHGVTVEAGGETALELKLVPNARSVIVETDPDDVEVWLDGVSVGRTARDAGVERGPGRLVLEHLSLGDHAFEFRRDCYRTERRDEIVTIDLLDRGALRLDPVTLVPARATLVLNGVPEGAEVFVEGERAGRLPIDPYEICPGMREIEVRFGGRTLWRERQELRPSATLAVEVTPRPNAALYGAAGWPPALREIEDAFNTVAVGSIPPGADLTTARGWAGLRLPADTDLAVAVLPAPRDGARERWMLYSPILSTVAELDVPPSDVGPPAWTGVVWGFAVADAAAGGEAVVVEVDPEGPASAAGLAVGDRIVGANGVELRGSAALRGKLEAASVELATSRAGSASVVKLRGRVSPVLFAEPLPAAREVILAAWAVAQAAAASDRAPGALANLALMLSRHGQHDLAATTWKRVKWDERRGVGAGTVAYYLGRELEWIGREQEAIEAYRRAASSASTAFRDDGPPVAPAARDRLVDLGVRLEELTAR